jgi:hypothetical protein
VVTGVGGIEPARAEIETALVEVVSAYRLSKSLPQIV